MKNKFKVFFSLEKEEEWLNKQLQAGWELVSLPGDIYYRFKESTAKDKVIQLDYRKFSSKYEFENYLQFMEDAGWQHLSGEYNSGTQYFLGLKGQTPKLFSDKASLLERSKRIRNGGIYSLLLAQFFALLWLKDSVDFSYLHLNKLFFHTFSKSGWHFWGSFLLESPAALLRFIVHLGFPIVIVLVLLGMIALQGYYLQQKKKLQKSL